MSKKLIVANFKMNKTNAELTEYFNAFPAVGDDYPNTVVFCPSMTGLSAAKSLLPRNTHLGAQNIHFEKHGAFTGEVSADMAAACGAEYVIIGHSERRGYFDEDDTVINKKIAAAAAAGLTVVLCIGESEDEHGEGRTKNVLSRQINGAINGQVKGTKIVIAYEPVWAVGNGTPAGRDEIAAAIADIKKIVPRLPVLYGGSVGAKNAGRIMAIPGVDGVLVGKACLDPKKFVKICGR